MCGICGFYGIEDKELLNRMMDVMKHRGPDEYGTYIGRNVCMGHRRLSIIDLKTGKQPISNESGSIYVVHNGEIYNFIELRKELEKKGHKFYTNSDSEVIVHMYEEEGVDCVKRFNGQFAFAIWDDGRRRLFIARDRMGIKPLYYALVDKVFFFASEIKAILQYKEFPKRINYVALNNFFTYRFIHGKITALQDVQKLEPGHYLTYDKAHGLKINQYWDFDFRPGHESIQHYIHKFRSLLKDSVKKRLISDVPLGAFIGGGIDSNSIIAYMAEFIQEPIKTFTLGFAGESDTFNEFKPSRIVADYYKTDHHEILIESKEVLSLIHI